MSDRPLLQCVEIEPPAPARSAVVWLHGLGADGHDFEPIVPYLGIDPKLATRFVFPHAPRRPVTINGGMQMPAWYDILSLSLEREVDEAGLLDSISKVDALLRRERERGIPADRIVVAGFSQGGAVALDTALRYTERLAGVLALSTYLLRPDALAGERTEANAGIPIFQAHGDHDPMVPPEMGLAALRELTRLGYPVEWKTYPMAHEVHPEELADIGAALNRMLGADRG